MPYISTDERSLGVLNGLQHLRSTWLKDLGPDDIFASRRRPHNILLRSGAGRRDCPVRFAFNVNLRSSQEPLDRFLIVARGLEGDVKRKQFIYARPRMSKILTDRKILEHRPKKSTSLCATCSAEGRPSSSIPDSAHCKSEFTSFVGPDGGTSTCNLADLRNFCSSMRLVTAHPHNTHFRTSRRPVEQPGQLVASGKVMVTIPVP